MDVTPILDSLNDAQRQAVTAPAEPTLVIAGAGSGKTRVLVHRAAWLIDVEGVSPHSLLAVTFTNKAAAEMRHRIEALLNLPVQHLWIGTFHGLAHRMLRRHWREANLPQNFQIIDSDDQLRLLKRLFKNLEVDDSRWAPKEIQWFINAQKDEGLRPQHIDDGGDPNRRQMISLYASYEDVCQRGGLVDFAELLLRAHELLRDNAELLAHYRRRFQHLLVDEFQDTNAIQYAWLRLLAGADGVPFVVGDDDQSIYRWRGARVEHIHQFQKDFPGTRVVKLEQNYRSTATILNAANAVIANNASRLGKNLWTEGAEGEAIKVYSAYNERDEADFVIGRLRDWIDQGNLRADSAILYRSNAQSRVLEEGLINAGIPYRVYGGLRFFERMEIKDALAYLRLIANRDDDSSFERIVNKPTRGIGARTIDMMRSYARANACSLWRAGAAIASDDLNGRAANAVNAFLSGTRLAGQGRSRHSPERPRRFLQEGQRRKRRDARRKPGRTRQRREELHTGSGRRDVTARRISFACGAGGRRGAGRCLGRLCATHDHALREGPRISAGLYLRHGGRPVPAPAIDCRSERSRGGATPVLRRHYAGQGDPLHHTR
jgi:DNA helicase-2/ATP-dependent DNA helicase PcrA